MNSRFCADQLGWVPASAPASSDGFPLLRRPLQVRFPPLDRPTVGDFRSPQGLGPAPPGRCADLRRRRRLMLPSHRTPGLDGIICLSLMTSQRAKTVVGLQGILSLAGAHAGFP